MADRLVTKVAFAATLLLVAGCSDAPLSVKANQDLEDVLAEFVRDGTMSQARAQIFLEATRLKPGEVLMVRDTVDAPDGGVVRSLRVVGDPSLRMYVVKREPELTRDS